MKTYLDLLQDIMDNGVDTENRTGVKTRTVIGRQARFNLQDGFPLLTTKRVWFKGIVEELLWFLRGETNIASLQEKNVHIWDEWADKDGELGPVYGYQWRHWPTQYISDGTDGKLYLDFAEIDQISNVIDRIKTHPDCRRLIVSAWNPAEVDNMALPPCHCFFQFHVINGKLSCQMYQRSCDAFLGVPFNIASYALLTHMVAHVTKLEVGEFIHDYGNLHIYHNHFDQIKKQLSREPLELPQLKINRQVDNIDSFKFEDFELINYQSHPSIRGEVAI